MLLSKFKITMAVFIAFAIVIITIMGFDLSQINAQSIPEKALGYGLVWYGLEGNFQRMIGNQPNRYYDPDKPAIIFIHGWMPDQAGEPPTFMVDFESLDEAKEIITGDKGPIHEWRDFKNVYRLLEYRILVDNPKLMDALIALGRRPL